MKVLVPSLHFCWKVRFSANSIRAINKVSFEGFSTSEMLMILGGIVHSTAFFVRPLSLFAIRLPKTHPSIVIATTVMCLTTQPEMGNTPHYPLFRWSYMSSNYPTYLPL